MITLADEGAEVLAVFDNVFFDEDLVFEDRDGDGLKEPGIAGGVPGPREAPLQR